MNLSSGHTAFPRGKHTNSGAGGSLGAAGQAGPAHPLQWSRELAEEVMDQMAESIVDLAHKLEESEARVAVLEEEQKILRAEAIVEELDNERLGGRIEEWRECAEKLADALRLCDESVLSRHPASRAGEVIVQAWNEFLRMRQEFGPCNTLSGGGERLNPRIPGSQPGAVRRETRSVDEGREADADHDSRGRVRPAQSIRGVSMEELREEVRHKYEADRVGGHEWGNI